jgi:hypothetical protein
MGRVPLLVAAAFAVAVTLLLYAGIRWGWPFILLGLIWLAFNRLSTPAQGRRRRR